MAGNTTGGDCGQSARGPPQRSLWHDAAGDRTSTVPLPCHSNAQCCPGPSSGPSPIHPPHWGLQAMPSPADADISTVRPLTSPTTSPHACSRPAITPLHHRNRGASQKRRATGGGWSTQDARRANTPPQRRRIRRATVTCGLPPFSAESPLGGLVVGGGGCCPALGPRPSARLRPGVGRGWTRLRNPRTKRNVLRAARDHRRPCGSVPVLQAHGLRQCVAGPTPFPALLPANPPTKHTAVRMPPTQIWQCAPCALATCRESQSTAHFGVGEGPGMGVTSGVSAAGCCLLPLSQGVRYVRLLAVRVRAMAVGWGGRRWGDVLDPRAQTRGPKTQKQWPNEQNEEVRGTASRYDTPHYYTFSRGCTAHSSPLPCLGTALLHYLLYRDTNGFALWRRCIRA